ncbi:DNA-binding transcriptional repressor GlpR [compost metagenome]
MKVAQAIIANARHVIVVADATKFTRTAPVRIGHLGQAHSFITDICRVDSIRQICADANIALIETGLA